MREYIKDFMVYFKNKEEVESFIKTIDLDKSNVNELLQDIEVLKDSIDIVAFRMSEYTDGNIVKDIYLSEANGDDRYYL